MGRPRRRGSERLCISAFFSELAVAARQRTIVVLFDTVDAVTEQLQRWIFLQLVKRRVLVEGGQDQQLVVVLAGSDIHTKLERMFEDEFQSFFDPITELEIGSKRTRRSSSKCTGTRAYPTT